MKITEMEVMTYDVPMKHTWVAAGFDEARKISHRGEVVVRLHTDEGISGFGHADFHHIHPKLAVTYLENLIKPVVVGKDPFQIEKVWDQMIAACRDSPHGLAAAGGVNVAMLDIVGKSLGVPIYMLLGGDNSREIVPYVGTYTMGWRELDDMDSLVEEAKKFVKMGYKALKLRGGRGLPDHKEDILSVKSVREEFGENIDILMDANGGYGTEGAAVKTCRELEKYNLFWLEDPVYDPAGKSIVAAQVVLPIHSG